VLGYLSVQLVSKISNVCDPDPPTLQTDRQTDDMRSQYRALHKSASRGKNWSCCSLLRKPITVTKYITDGGNG